MRKNKIFQYCYILTLAAFAASALALAGRFSELNRNNEFYEHIIEPEKPASAGAKARKHEPAQPEVHELSLRFAGFAAEYPDAAIWLQLPGTTLDYPVLLGTDNQFYLNHLPDGSPNALGSLFLDYRTRADSPHLIVYGHNGSGGRMFGLLKQYESQDYFSAHKTLTVAVSDCVYVCPIFSVRRVEADGGAYQLEFEDGGSLERYIQQAAKHSLYQTGADLEDAKGVLTLSTCTGRRTQRFIVQALVPSAQSPIF